MNTKDYLKDWVKKLESKQYKQSTGTLIKWDKNYRKDEFCCLGVCTRVFYDRSKQKKLYHEKNVGSSTFSGYVQNLSFHETPKEEMSLVGDWLRNPMTKKGLSKVRGIMLKKGTTDYKSEISEAEYREDLFIYLNDQAGFSFEEIAQVIRADARL